MKEIPFYTPLRTNTHPTDLPTPVSGETDKTYFIPVNDGLAFVKVINAGMSAENVSVTPSATISGIVAAPVVFVCPVGESWLPVFPPAIYNDVYSDCILVDVSGTLAFTGLRV